MFKNVKPHLIMLIIVVLGVVVANMIIKYKEIDPTTGKPSADGKVSKGFLSFGRKK